MTPIDDRSLVGGVPDTGVAPGVTGDGDNANRGYAASKTTRPSAMPDPGLHSARDRAEEPESRTFDGDATAPAASAAQADFNDEPDLIQDITDGSKPHKH